MTEERLPLGTPIAIDVGRSDFDLLDISDKATGRHIGSVSYDRDNAHIRFLEGIVFIDRDGSEVADSVIDISLDGLSLDGVKGLMMYMARNCTVVWDLFYMASIPTDIIRERAARLAEEIEKKKASVGSLSELLSANSFEESIRFAESFFTTGKGSPIRYYWRLTNENGELRGSIEYLKDENAVRIYLKDIMASYDNPVSGSRDIMFVTGKGSGKAMTSYILESIDTAAELFLLRSFTAPFSPKAVRDYLDEWRKSGQFRSKAPHRDNDLLMYSPISLERQDDDDVPFGNRFVDIMQDGTKVATMSYDKDYVRITFANKGHGDIAIRSSDPVRLMNWWAVSADRLQDFLYNGGRDEFGIPLEKDFEFYQKVNRERYKEMLSEG